MGSNSTLAPTICILRLSALGDCCNLVPAVRALQRAWPQARITWVIGAAEHSLLSGLSGVEFIIYDKKTGLAGMRALKRTLQGRRFDILLHMQAALRASVLSLFIPAQRRIGFDKARAKDFQWLFTRERITPNPQQHVAEGFMDFVRHLGIQDTQPEWNLAIPSSNEQQAQALVEGHTPYLVLSPCSSNRARNWRNWSVEGYQAVIQHTYEKHGLKTVITGGHSEEEKHYGQALQQASPEAVINLVGKTPLKTLLALIKNANAVIAPDSGPIHMAVALQRPAIGLYVTSNPLRTGPWHQQEWVVNYYPQALDQFLQKTVSEVKWGQRVRDPNAMLIIPTHAVTDKIDLLMQPGTEDNNNEH